MKKKIVIMIMFFISILSIGILKYNTNSINVDLKKKTAPSYYNEVSNSTIKLQWNRNGNTYNINVHYVYADGSPLLSDAELNNIVNSNNGIPTIDGTNLYLDHLWSVAKSDNEYAFSKVMYGTDFSSAKRIKIDLYSYGSGTKSNKVYCNEVTNTNGNLTDLWNTNTEIELSATSDVWLVYEPRYEIENGTYVINWEVYKDKVYKVRFHFVDKDGNNIANEAELKKLIAKDIGHAGENLPVRQYTDLYMDKTIFGTSLNDYNLLYISYGSASGQKIKKDIYTYTYEHSTTKSDKLYYNKVDDTYTGQWDVQTEVEMDLVSDIYLVFEPINYISDDGVYHVDLKANGTNTYHINFHYVDKDMNPLKRDDMNLENYPRVIGRSNIFLDQQKEIKVKGKDYVFSRVVYDDNVVRPVIYYVAGDENLYYNNYSGDSGRDLYLPANRVAFPSNDVDIYLVYDKELKKLPTVQTVDNNKYDFKLKIANFSEEDLAVIGGPTWQESEGRASQGLFSKYLAENGFPVIESNQTNLGDIYDKVDSYDATNLFLKSYFDNPKTKNVLHYSSAENFASFDSNTGKFNVYDVLGTAYPDDMFFYSRGLFMPFNTLDKTNIINYNWYDYKNEKIQNENYSNDIYGYNEENDYHFGLYGTAKFKQEKGGLFNGNTSTITIAGDDDILLYIDGVLVGDLGGIHDAQILTVNFKTGVIEWTTNKTNESGSRAQTTFAEIYSSLDEEKQAELAKLGWNSETTLKDDTEHELSFFYFERGYSAADLELEFAIPLVFTEKNIIPVNPNTGTLVSELIVIISLLVLSGAFGLSIKKRYN